jgi:ribosomal silencing factor RsfS
MDTIVHVFYEPVRHYYEFDALWKREQEVPLEEDIEPLARRLRTGAV